MDRTLHMVRCLHAARAGAVRRGARTACAPTTGVKRRDAQSVAIVVFVSSSTQDGYGMLHARSGAGAHTARDIRPPHPR